MAVDRRILERSEDENNDFVWLDLHQIEDSSAVERFRKGLQRNLPDDMPEAERARVTRRSWRKGSCILLSHHRDVRRANAMARSGHKMGSNQFETYVDSCGIGISLPSAMALNGFPDIFAIPKAPSFEVLSRLVDRPGHHPGHLAIVKFIQQFLPSNLPDFQPEGRLIPVLEQLTATVVMTYNDMLKRYGQRDPVVFKLETICKQDPNLSVALLVDMSKTMKEGYQNDNKSMQKIIDSSNAMQLINAVNHTSSTVADIILI